MKNIAGFQYCYGCGVCASACPKKTISMRTDSNGFYIPEVDPEGCVECGICLDVCSFNHKSPLQEKNFEIKSFASWSKDPKTRLRCSSGGVGFEIGRSLLEQGYSAIVCRYNPDTRRAEHYIARTEEELLDSIGSKYIPSDSYNGFSRIKKGRKYFIAGTPCQIDSIRRWIRRMKMEDDVVLLDFFCHGVPSLLLWDKYISEVEHKIGKLGPFLWRDKETGWHDSWVMKIPGRYASWFSKGDLFYRMFLADRCLGKQCYHDCKFKYDRSAADIRIGDLWGRKYKHDEKGVNGVVCNTPKGVEIMEKLTDKLYIDISSLAIVGEAQMKKCAHKPISYKFVMRSLKEATSLETIYRKAYRMEIVDRIIKRTRYYASRFPSKICEIIGLKQRLEQ